MNCISSPVCGGAGTGSPKLVPRSRGSLPGSVRGRADKFPRCSGKSTAVQNEVNEMAEMVRIGHVRDQHSGRRATPNRTKAPSCAAVCPAREVEKPRHKSGPTLFRVVAPALRAFQKLYTRNLLRPDFRGSVKTGIGFNQFRPT